MVVWVLPPHTWFWIRIYMIFRIKDDVFVLSMMVVWVLPPDTRFWIRIYMILRIKDDVFGLRMMVVWNLSLIPGFESGFTGFWGLRRTSLVCIWWLFVDGYFCINSNGDTPTSYTYLSSLLILIFRKSMGCPSLCSAMNPPSSNFPSIFISGS